MFSAAKYYFKCAVDSEREVPESDEVQHTTAQLYVPAVISSAESLDLRNLVASLQNSVEAFTSRVSGWNVTQIRGLSLCIGCFARPPDLRLSEDLPKLQRRKRLPTSVTTMITNVSNMPFLQPSTPQRRIKIIPIRTTNFPRTGHDRHRYTRRFIIHSKI